MKLAPRRRLWYQPGMRFALILCLVAGSVRADDGARPNDGAPIDAARIDVAVGETVARDVGIAVGLRCDDPSIARVELRTVTPQSNLFEVTGVKAGTTLCRVGTVQLRPSYLFELQVVAAGPRR